MLIFMLHLMFIVFTLNVQKGWFVLMCNVSFVCIVALSLFPLEFTEPQ